MKSVKSQQDVRSAASQKVAEPASIIQKAQERLFGTVKDAQVMVATVYQTTALEVRSIRTSTTAKVESLRSLAFAYVQQTREAVQTAAHGVSQRVSVVEQTLQKARSTLSRRISSSTASLLDSAAAVRDATRKEYTALRSSGLRAWTSQRSRAIAGLTRQVAADLRSNGVAAYVHMRARLVSAASSARSQVLGLRDDAIKRSRSAGALTKAKALQVGSSARELAQDTKVQATVAGAAGGAVTLGAGGAASGLAVGTTLGAVVGFVPAVFTLGLSIPVGAAIGGGAGLMTGAAIGSTAGVVGGGAAGYGVYTEREQLKAGAQQAWQRAGAGADLVRDSIVTSSDFVKGRASAVRSRLSRGVAGGA